MKSFALHLLRHGEPEGVGRLIGRTDAPPTIAGITACVDKARGRKVEALVASDLSRARLAGEAIGRAIGIPLTIDPRWRELDFGAWDGLDLGDVDADALARFQDDPDGQAPPAGECWSALVHRVSAAISGLAPQSTLVVTHAGAIRAALTILCGFDQRQAWAIDLPYACLVSLRVWSAAAPGGGPWAQVTEVRP